VTGEKWRSQGVCAETDPEVFYPENEDWSAPAKRVCAVCPVVAQCLGYALISGEPYGVWGGLTTAERQLVGAVLIGAVPSAGKAAILSGSADGPERVA
jgi:hypothetical protein